MKREEIRHTLGWIHSSEQQTSPSVDQSSGLLPVNGNLPETSAEQTRYLIP